MTKKHKFKNQIVMCKISKKNKKISAKIHKKRIKRELKFLRSRNLISKKDCKMLKKQNKKGFISRVAWEYDGGGFNYSIDYFG